MTTSFVDSDRGQKKPRYAQIHVEIVPSERAAGRIDPDRREIRRGGGLQRRNPANGKRKEAPICQLEYDAPCGAVGMAVPVLAGDY